MDKESEREEFFVLKTKIKVPHSDFGEDTITLVLEGETATGNPKILDIQMKLPELIHSIADYIQEEDG